MADSAHHDLCPFHIDQDSSDCQCGCGSNGPQRIGFHSHVEYWNKWFREEMTGVRKLGPLAPPDDRREAA